MNPYDPFSVLFGTERTIDSLPADRVYQASIVVCLEPEGYRVIKDRTGWLGANRTFADAPAVLRALAEVMR